MIEKRIAGARIQLGGSLIAADILIEDELIAGIVKTGQGLGSEQVIDATGLIAIPGLVDLHAHMRTPGLSYKEDFRTGSMAAANGGFTTWVDMPNVEPPTDSVERFEHKRHLAATNSIIDFGHFASASRPDEIASLAAAGVTGYKIFMVGGGYPHDDRIAVNSSADLWVSFHEVAKTGLPCSLHYFNQSLFDLFSEREFESGSAPDHRTRSRVYTNRDIVWSSAADTALRCQEETQVRLHMLHTHTVGSLELIRRAKERGQTVTCALDPKYFTLTAEDMDRLGTRAYHGAYITRDPSRIAEIWRSISDGTIDVIDSDHGPHTKAENEAIAADAWSAPGGTPQYDDMLAIMLTAVNDGHLTLSDIVRLMSSNPAKLIGHFPRKGSLLPGTDADITLLDMERTLELNDERLYTKVGWTPYLGRRVKGMPVMTIASGRVIMKEGEVTGDNGVGRYLAGVSQKQQKLGRKSDSAHPEK